MPANIIVSFAQKTGKSEAEVEKLWNQAKAEADKNDNLEKDSDRYYAYVTGILKKMLSIDEYKEKYESDKYYAMFGGKIVGPYDSQAKAYKDTGGDVKWIKLGSKIHENLVMNKQEQRRALTRQFIQKVAGGQKFDAAADLKEMIRLSKEIRYNDLAATVEI